MATKTGNSSEDITRRSQVGALARNNGSPHTIDPVDEALSTRRKMLGSRILESTITEEELTAQKNRNELLKAQIEEKALEQHETTSGSDPGWMQYLMAEIADARSLAQQALQAQSQAEKQILTERLGMLQEEVQRLGQQPQQNGNLSVLSDLKQRMLEAQELADFLNPPRETLPAVIKEDPSIKLLEIRASFDQERWREEHAAAHVERLAEIEADKEVRMREVQIQEAHLATVDRFMTSTAPRLLDLGESLMQRFMGAAPGAPGAPAAGAPVAAAQTTESAAPPEGPTLAPGVQVTRCESEGCGADIFFRPEWHGVICQKCGTEYKLNETSEGQPPEDPEKPPMQGPSGPASWEMASNQRSLSWARTNLENHRDSQHRYRCPCGHTGTIREIELHREREKTDDCDKGIITYAGLAEEN